MRIDPTKMPLRRAIAVRISRELRLRAERRGLVDLWDVLGMAVALAMAIGGLNLAGAAVQDPGAMLHATER